MWLSVNGSISGLTQDEKRLIEVCWFKCTQKQLKKCAEDIFSDILHTDESLLKLFSLTLGYQHVSLRDHGFQTIYWDIFTDCFERNRPPSFRKEAEKEVDNGIV
ncbi:hypothetical protein ANCDUO_04402 [Ancylostoma duodenale]|uniref:Uncharacterized protein n=1 Tax=Ancylostoma duodenale TaxID=51022 RepID=A0A0C2DRB6_9BILA|nr:hypothetical protein ANCDUO_04402 [Ancylostoma duodenale]